MPTIADAIDARIPWELDGISLIGPDPGRSQTTTFGPKGDVTFGVGGREKLEVAGRIEEWFPDGDPWALQPTGSPDLLGRRLNVDSLEDSAVTARLRMPALYLDLDVAGDLIPVRVGGRLLGPVDGTEMVAVVVNGVVGGITRSYVRDDGVWFVAMIRPDALVDGDNLIDLVHVTPDGEPRLIRQS
jgi:hypothetical protein